MGKKGLPDKEEKGLSFRDYWQVLYKRRWIFLIAFLGVWGISIFHSLFLSESQYRSAAELMIGPPVVQVASERGMQVRERYDIINEIELMQSDFMSQKVSELLKNDPEEPLDISSGGVRGSVQVERHPRAQVVVVSAVGSDPKMVFRLVKGLIAAYIDEGQKRREKAIRETYEALSRELLAKHEEIEDAERALTKFVLEHDILARGIEVGENARQIRRTVRGEPDINEKYLNLKSQRINQEAFLGEIKKNRQESELIALGIVHAREKGLVDYAALRRELYLKEKQLSKFLLTQSDLHPDVIEARGEVEEARKKISLELDRAIQRVELNVRTLKREEDKLRSLIEEGLSEKMVRYSALKREVGVKKKIYNGFINQVQLLDVTQNLGNIPFVKVLKEPYMPGRPINNRSRNIFLSLIFAVIVGFTSVALTENMDISIGSVDEVEDNLGLTVLSILPFYTPKAEVLEKQSKRSRLILGLIAVHEPKSMLSEAFRTLRTNIKFVNTDRPLKSFVITSPGPKEGKSFISSNLAVTMAKSGDKVILIDGDLRRPMMHKYFNLDNSVGLSTILAGKQDLEFDRYATDVENLSVVPSGPLPPNPNELLGAKKTEELISAFGKEADVVIIDSPPLLSVSDSVILAAKTEGVVLVFLADKTAKTAGIRASVMLKNAGVNVIGGIINGVKTDKSGYYYYYKYGYYGKSKYGYHDEEK